MTYTEITAEARLRRRHADGLSGAFERCARPSAFSITSRWHLRQMLTSSTLSHHSPTDRLEQNLRRIQ